MSGDRSAALAEAARRGLLTPERLGAYQEAVKRGIVSSGGDSPVVGEAERDVGIAETKAREEQQGFISGMSQRFREGFAEGFGKGAPLGGPLEIVTQPVRATLAGFSGLRKGLSEALPRDVVALPEAFAGSATGMLGSPGVGTAAMEAAFPGAGLAAKATSQTKAQSAVEKAFGKSVAGGETTALNVMDQISAARQQGQPLTLSDVGGRPIRRLAGTIYRSGGEPAAHMEKFYKGRSTDLTLDHLNTTATQRIEKAIGENIATGSFKEASKNLIAERSARARPLWEEATAGGSVAPLEHQFAGVFNEASAAEQKAAQELAQAKNEATQGAARQSTAGNVYAASGANRLARETGDKVKAAETQLATARRAADEARARLRQAQDDGTANAPGAVWSPRLQQFLNLPDWQEGIRRGLSMERRDAVTEGRRFNPSEYAIVGEKDGEPVVGAVPTMKLLQVAKEGIAAKIDDLRDPLTGGLTKAGRSLWLNFKAFEAEGYRLNPAWKAANDAWSGDSASIRALQLGKKVFSMPMEDLAEEFGAMSKSDKELFRLSAASKAIEDVRKTPLAADPSKRVINSPDELGRLRLLFDNDQDFQSFVGNIQRERTMFETPGDVMRGSQTAERMSADVGIGLDVAHGAGSLMSGHVMSAVAPFLRALKGLGLRQNPKLNLEVAKILTDPNLTLADSPFGLLSGTRSFEQVLRK